MNRRPFAVTRSKSKERRQFWREFLLKAEQPDAAGWTCATESFRPFDVAVVHLVPTFAKAVDLRGVNKAGDIDKPATETLEVGIEGIAVGIR